MSRMFRLLNADEIECRVQSSKENGSILLLYKNARCDMNILDETVGPMNWQRDHKELKGVMYAGVGIYDDDRAEWVWKWDCGAESNTEAQKGEASDSFKRACVNWGIGRELYTAPFIWVSREDYECIPQTVKCKDSFVVKEIGYDENGNINHLVINNAKSNKRVYPKGKTENKEKTIAGYPSRDKMLECARTHYPDSMMQILLDTFGICKIDDASDAQLASVWNKYGK